MIVDGGLANRMAVDRDAGRHHDAIVSGEVGRDRIGQFHPFAKGIGDRLTRLVAAVPGQHMCPAFQQRPDHGQPGPGQSENRVAPTGEVGRDDHRNFSVDRPMIARMIETIQNRITTVDSAQPSFSK